jgi:hypothetical protein
MTMTLGLQKQPFIREIPRTDDRLEWINASKINNVCSILVSRRYWYDGPPLGNAVQLMLTVRLSGFQDRVTTKRHYNSAVSSLSINFGHNTQINQDMTT